MRLVSCTKQSGDEFHADGNKSHLRINYDKHNLEIVKAGSQFSRPSNWNGTEIIVYFDNKKGLSECYNEAIEAEMRIKTDYLVFIHDDVLITDAFWKEKLEGWFTTYDVIGVAGSSNFSVKRKPVCWSNCPPKDWAGSVEHPSDDKSGGVGGTFITSFGMTPKQVLVIDGLFMAVNLRRLGDVRFDPVFNFDFYDTDFCISCVKAGLKIGVVNIMCYHDSHGKGIKSERYEELQQKFVNKWSVRK